MKKCTLAVVTAGLLSASLLSAPVMAIPSDAMIDVYNQAAEGDKILVDVAHQSFEKHITEQGVDPLSLVYLGSTQTLMGRDAWMPWNQMAHTEKGLATIAKGLDLLASSNTPLTEQQTRQGLPESYLARSIAASTFTSLPDLFNHFERGYDLFLELLAEEAFNQQNYEATAWVYFYAVQAALRAQDMPQAKAWLEAMTQQGAQHPLTQQAKDLIESEA